ncbi:MAG: ribosomal protein S18-alanine N-acetyltransferase [candidate division WOR-3 bacterium]|nr:MAG: ribosomal protein S18-alanine N-acetyltransferase [candidate division WOR-3 bacterium]
MQREDLGRVYEIEVESFPNPWPRVFFENDLKSPKAVALVAENKTTIVGYSIATCVDDELHITNIAVDKNYQRQGIATQLMDKLENIAEERGCTYAYLEVRTHNLAAINMYKNIGYNILYIRKQYYIDGDDAYVMSKELP